MAFALLQLLLPWQPAQGQFAVDGKLVHSPSPERFSVCYGHGCRDIALLGLSAAEWHRVRNRLTPPPADAVEERHRIADAIALLENLVGERTGTSRDIGGTFPGTGKSGQMDCTDEATNTTTYLKMMAGNGLLHWHTVDENAVRGFFIFGWPHITAVIRETETGQRYAVDSWFHDNGAPPEILPLKTWRSGWRPTQ